LDFGFCLYNFWVNKYIFKLKKFFEDLFVVAVLYRFVLIAVKIASIAVHNVILILGHINVFLEVLEVIKEMLLLWDRINWRGRRKFEDIF